jgi:hypothetical protein
LASLAPAAPGKGVSAASARSKPAFDEQDRGEDGGDDKQLAGAASIDRRADDQEHQCRGEDDADDDLEKKARA